MLRLWGTLQPVLLPLEAPGAPREKRWLEPTLLSCPCLGGYIGDGRAAGGLGCAAGGGGLQGSEQLWNRMVLRAEGQQEEMGSNTDEKGKELSREEVMVCAPGNRSCGVTAALWALSSPVSAGEEDMCQPGHVLEL